MTDEARVRTALPFVPLALVPWVLAVCAQGVPHIAPVWWVGGATVAGFALCCFRGGSIPRRSDLLVVAAMALAAHHLLLRPGFPLGHDAHHHAWGIWAVFKAVLDGDWYPGWVHHIGAGMPLLQFYSPASFLLLLPLLPLGLPPYTVLKAGLLGFSVLSGATMYWLLKRWTGDRHAALLAALAYVWSPYMLLDQHYRVALAEAAAFIVLPLFFGHVVDALRGVPDRRRAAAALSTALLLVTHPISTVVAVIGVVAWICIEWWPLDAGWRRWVAQLSRLTGIVLLGAMLAGVYTLPLLVQGRYTSLSGAIEMAPGEATFAAYGVTPIELLAPRRWSDMQLAHVTGSMEDQTGEEMPYYVGLTLLASIVAAAWPRRCAASAQPHAVPAGLVAVALAGLVLSLRPFDRLLGHLLPFAIVQFPWRFLALTTFGAAACAGFASVRGTMLVETCRGGRALRPLVPALLATLIIVDGFPYTGAPIWGPDYRGVAYVVRRTEPCLSCLDRWAAQPVNEPPPLRADGFLLLPPTDYSINLSRFGFVYPELYTPRLRAQVYGRLFGAEPDAALIDAAVSWSISAPGPTLRHLDAKPYAEWTGADGRSLALSFTRRAGTITVQLPGDAGEVIVREQWFPGWMVRRGNRWNEATYTPQGFLRARVAARDAALQFRFSSWRADRIGGAILSLLTCALLFIANRQRAGGNGVR